MSEEVVGMLGAGGGDILKVQGATCMHAWSVFSSYHLLER